MWTLSYNCTYEFYLPLHFPRRRKYRHRGYRVNPFENSLPIRHFWFTERETPKEKGARLRHNWIAYNYRAKMRFKGKRNVK